MKQISERIEYFAVLRGIAILMVILTHIHQFFDIPDYLRIIPRLGQLGCQIFFVISGFFAFNPLYIERGRCFSKKSIVDYYKKKLKRIAPGYWMTILLGFLVTVFSIEIYGKSLTKISTNIQDILVNIFFINGLVPTKANNYVVRGGWFIGTLVIFYLLTPYLSAIYKKISHKGIFILPTAFFVFSTLILTTLSYMDNRLTCWNNSFFYFSFVNQMSCFLLGYTLKDIYDKREYDSIKNPIYKALVTTVLSIVIFFGGSHYLTNIAFSVIPFVVGLATFFWSCHFLKKGNSNKHTLLKNVAIKFGELDYTIMLIHPFIAFDLSRIIIRVFNIPHTSLFLICIPIEIAIIYVVSKIYQKGISILTRIIFDRHLGI